MIRLSRARRAAWPLRRGDLPSAHLRGLEPRLAGLQNNPVFRLIVFRRHLSSSGGFLLPAAILVFVLAMIFARRFGGFMSTLSIFFLVFAIARRRAANSRRVAGPHSFMGLPPVFVADLCAAAVPLGDYVRGLWGSAVTTRARLVKLVSIALGLALCLFVVLFGPFPLASRYYATVGLFVLFAQIGLVPFAPYTVLPRQTAYLKFVERRLELRAHPVRWVGLVLRRLLFYLPFIVLIAAWVVIVAANWPFVKSHLPFDPASSSGPIGIALATSALGLFFGLARGAYISRSSARYLDAIGELVARLLDPSARAAMPSERSVL